MRSSVISVKVKNGDFSKTTKYLQKLKDRLYMRKLTKYAELGLKALIDATPKRSGLTSSSWDYYITKNDKGATIHWINNNVNQHMNVALLIQYGHGTGTGGYVQGIDYINPALKPVFDKIAKDLFKEVKDL